MFFDVGVSETIFWVVGLFIGIVIAIIRARYWRKQINEYEEKNQSLTKANKKINAKVNNLSTTLQEYKANTQDLSEKLNQSIANNHSLSKEINERNQAITQLKEEVNAVRAHIKTVNAHANKAEMDNEELENSLKEKENELKNLQSHSQEQESTITQMQNQATQLTEKIQRLTAQVEERDRSINQLQEAVNIRDRDIHDWKTRSEEVQIKIIEMETLYAEKVRDIATLEAQIRSMQDNLTIIAGIGPKVSTVLRSAGVTTFVKLATLNVKKIEEILLAENTRLLQLVDPTTWPEQASLASTGEWEDLKSLQNSLKGKRSTLSEDSVDLENDQITTDNLTPPARACG
jgi:predicted flap endonuclease-1-like 5' DNA nuclease/outer membrane murein-binding lipoprotein Lpp